MVVRDCSWEKNPKILELVLGVCVCGVENGVEAPSYDGAGMVIKVIKAHIL